MEFEWRFWLLITAEVFVVPLLAALVLYLAGALALRIGATVVDRVRLRDPEERRTSTVDLLRRRWWAVVAVVLAVVGLTMVRAMTVSAMTNTDSRRSRHDA